MDSMDIRLCSLDLPDLGALPNTTVETPILPNPSDSNHLHVVEHRTLKLSADLINHSNMSSTLINCSTTSLSCFSSRVQPTSLVSTIFTLKRFSYLRTPDSRLLIRIFGHVSAQHPKCSSKHCANIPCCKGQALAFAPASTQEKNSKKNGRALCFLLGGLGCWVGYYYLSFQHLCGSADFQCSFFLPGIAMCVMISFMMGTGCS